MNRLTTEVIEVTPEQAKSWLENNLYSNQRPLRRRHVVFLLDQMKKEQFAIGTQIYFAKLEDSLHLIDGQHRLSAIAQSETPLPVIVTTNHVSTIDEIAWLYTAFDRQMTRTAANAVRAVQPTGIEGWTSWQVNTFVGALRLVCPGFMKGTMYNNVGMPEILFGLNDWAPYAKEYFDVISGGDKDISRKLKRKPCLAVGMSTLRFAKNASSNSPYDFWQQVAEDDGLNANDARKQLNKRLITLDVLSPGSATVVRVDDISIIKLCTVAWNSYVNNKPMDRLPISRGRQYPINFTPFDYSKSVKEYRDMYDDGYKDYKYPVDMDAIQS